MKNNQFLQISCLGLIALLHGVSLNQSTIAKANNENDSSFPLLSSIFSNVKDTNVDFEITPVVDDFTHRLADELTNYNLEETQEYLPQPSFKTQTNLDFVFYDD